MKVETTSQLPIATVLLLAGVAFLHASAAQGLVQTATADSETRARAAHVLSRITYGPRPGDVDRVAHLGIEQFVAEQLGPETLPDPGLAERLDRFEVLRMSRGELALIFRAEAQARRERPRTATDSHPSGRAMDSGEPGARRRGRAPNSRMRQLIGQLQQATVVRAVLSERQLYEIMVDFWTNHFNVFLAKGAGRFLTPSYIEQVVRPRAIGTFEDLLIATATSPAMLVYLDNAESVRPGSEPPQLARARQVMARRRARRIPFGRGPSRARIDSMLQRAEERRPRGLNENYARELLELHTIGVDGGYGQQDVVEVARILTGWSVSPPQQGANFVFNVWAHDGGEKTVLDRRFAAGRGMDEGLELLRFLAGHPSTLRHVSGKLCQRFVSDQAPRWCIDAAVEAWRRSGGEIRAIVRAIVLAPEFHSPEHRDSKTKTPLEFVASALRATHAEPDTTLRLAQVIGRLGQPLFLHQPPTGYPETQESWISAGAVLDRLNVAVALAAGRLPGVRWREPRPPIAEDPDRLIATVNQAVLGGKATANTLRIMKEQLGTVTRPSESQAVALGLALGSPEFQRQ